MEYRANRVYEKRATEKSNWNGRVGATELVIASEGDIVATLGGVTLKPGSINYLLNFALQSLQDAYAGAESLTEAVANWEKKLKAVQEDTIGARGEGVGEFTRVARSIVRALLKKKFGGDSDEWKEFTKREDAEQNKVLDAQFEKNRETLEPAVQKEIDRRRAEAAAKKANMEGLDIAL